ncbi:MAG: MaoC/PaaZ C-terminal domain-containing protein [Candidatus Helarchaeota archaeon]
MVKWDDLKVGEVGPSMEYGPLTRNEFKVYANAGGDTNPIHQDYVAAIRAGNKGIIAHGLYSHAMLGKMLTDWVGADNVRAYNGRMVGMTRPGDIVYFTGIVTKKYEKDGEKLVDLDIKATTKTYYVRGEAKADSSLSDEEILKRLANGNVKVNIEWPFQSEMKFELMVEAEGIEFNPKRLTGEEALIRNWLRAGRDQISAEFLGKRKRDKFWFGIIRLRDSIVGTATVAIPE